MFFYMSGTAAFSDRYLRTLFETFFYGDFV